MIAIAFCLVVLARITLRFNAITLVPHHNPCSSGHTTTLPWRSYYCYLLNSLRCYLLGAQRIRLSKWSKLVLSVIPVRTRSLMRLSPTLQVRTSLGFYLYWRDISDYPLQNLLILLFLLSALDDIEPEINKSHNDYISYTSGKKVPSKRY